MEHPAHGDDLREAFKGKDGYNVAKEYFTRGKKSVTLDLKNPASKPVMEKLVKWARPTYAPDIFFYFIGSVAKWLCCPLREATSAVSVY